jgi:tetratricopeptide (TPR) repeat protein
MREIIAGNFRIAPRWAQLMAAFLALSSLPGMTAWAGDFDTLVAQGKDAITIGKYSEGEDLFNRALKIKPGHPEALYGAGMCALSRNSVTRATEYFKEVLKQTYTTREMMGFHTLAMMRLGEIFLGKGKAEEAAKIYSQGVKNEPGNPEMHYGYGLALRMRGMNELSLQQFEQAIELDPKHAGAHIGKGAVLFDMGKVPEAFAEIDKAIKAAPNLPTPFGVLSRFYAELQKPYEENLMLGSYYYGMGDFKEAEKSYRKAMSKKDTAEVRHTLGSTLAMTGKFREAEQNLRKAISMDLKPADPAWAALSNIQAKNGDLKEARKSITKAIKLNGGSPVYNAQLALLCLQMDDLEGAEAASRRALQIQPGYPVALRYLGDVYNKRGKARDAIEAYEKCLAEDSRSFPDVYVNLGWAYEQAGDFVSARRNYRTYLKMEQDPEVRKKVNEQIAKLDQREKRGSGK